MANLSEVKAKVQQILVENWNVRLGNRPNTIGDFIIDFESTGIHVAVNEGEGDSVIVGLWAPVLLEVGLSEDLYKWVATVGSNFTFGHSALFLNEDNVTGNLWFIHNLLGDYLDADELNWGVGSVGTTADHLDDEFQTQFGGIRACDAPSG